MRDLREEARQHAARLKNIRLCAFDCDGILTDGKVFWAGEEIGWNRTTHTSDGYGMKLLQRAGLTVGVISGGNSLSLHKRFTDNLKLDFLFAGKEDKRDAWRELIGRGFAPEEILYMGDELFDIPLLKACGFAATVPGAGAEVQEAVHYITEREAGEGCAREVIDLLRHAQGITPPIPEL